MSVYYETFKGNPTVSFMNNNFQRRLHYMFNIMFTNFTYQCL